jgi:hypothetical protein
MDAGLMTGNRSDATRIGMGRLGYVHAIDTVCSCVEARKPNPTQPPNRNPRSSPPCLTARPRLIHRQLPRFATHLERRPRLLQYGIQLQNTFIPTSSLLLNAVAQQHSPSASTFPYLLKPWTLPPPPFVFTASRVLFRIFCFSIPRSVRNPFDLAYRYCRTYLFEDHHPQ